MHKCTQSSGNREQGVTHTCGRQVYDIFPVSWKGMISPADVVSYEPQEGSKPSARLLLVGALQVRL